MFRSEIFPKGFRVIFSRICPHYTDTTPKDLKFPLHRHTYFHTFHLCKSVKYVNLVTNLNINCKGKSILKIIELLKKIGVLTTEYPDK